MKIFKALNASGYELCHPDGRDARRALIDGTPRLETWSPVVVRIIRENQGTALKESDSPWLGEWALIFRARALEGAVGDLLRRHGELLPLSCPDADLWFYNPTRILDALDEGGSSLERFKTGEIMRIDRHVFKAKVIAGVEIFKITSKAVSARLALRT